MFYPFPDYSSNLFHSRTTVFRRRSIVDASNRFSLETVACHTEHDPYSFAAARFGVDAGAGAGAGVGVDAATEAGVDVDVDAGVDAEAGVGAGADADIDVDASADADARAWRTFRAAQRIVRIANPCNRKLNRCFVWRHALLPTI